MSKKVKKLLRYCVVVSPFLFILLDIFRNGFVVSNIETMIMSYMDMITSSQLSSLYTLFSSIFGVNYYNFIIFVVFNSLLFTEFIIILFDLLMFIPNFIGKMFDKVGKVGVKDE